MLTMRRVQSAIVVMAMLAIPLALLARTGPCAQSQCSRMCAMILRSVNAAQHQHCTCGKAIGGAQCANHSSRQIPDYGLNAPIAPTMPSARASIAVLHSERRALVSDAAFASSGFRFELIQPPRV
ncbi:MAG: hypothetical protein ACRD3S_21915 [Terracidiphilus sp.]